ncbi:hypothetical protein [Streptomyces sp. NPDC048473]|uniref:hypothetical protein n=1 Tax=unclassified Streptomyces TaxID=2593676 RepID=UPI00371F96BA
MAIFEGARVEIHDEVWGEDCGQHTELGRTVSVWGRTASGAWLTRDDARCSLGEEDIDVLVENDGFLFITVEGVEQLVERVATAFPGAGVHYYSEDEGDVEGELDVAGVAPVFEIEYLMGRVKVN